MVFLREILKRIDKNIISDNLTLSKVFQITLNLIFGNKRTGEKIFGEDNPSPYRGSPTTIDKLQSGLKGASDGVYGVRK